MVKALYVLTFTLQCRTVSSVTQNNSKLYLIEVNMEMNFRSNANCFVLSERRSIIGVGMYIFYKSRFLSLQISSRECATLATGCPDPRMCETVREAEHLQRRVRSVAMLRPP